MKDVREEWVANPMQTYMPRASQPQDSTDTAEVSDGSMLETVESSKSQQAAKPTHNRIPRAIQPSDTPDVNAVPETVESSKHQQDAKDQEMESQENIPENVETTQSDSLSSCAAPEQAVKKRRRRKKKVCGVKPVVSHRFVKQLFVRGDNIVMVSPYKPIKSER